jgi:hypothetical protein
MSEPEKKGILRFKGNKTANDVLNSKSKGIKKEDNNK